MMVLALLLFSSLLEAPHLLSCNSPLQLLSMYLAWGCGHIPPSGSTFHAQCCQLCHTVVYTYLRPALSIHSEYD